MSAASSLCACDDTPAISLGYSSVGIACCFGWDFACAAAFQHCMQGHSQEIPACHFLFSPVISCQGVFHMCHSKHAGNPDNRKWTQHGLHPPPPHPLPYPYSPPLHRGIVISKQNKTTSSPPKVLGGGGGGILRLNETVVPVCVFGYRVCYAFLCKFSFIFCQSYYLKWNGMGSPEWNVSMVSIHIWKSPVSVLPSTCWCEWEVMEEIDWQAKQPSHVVCFSEYLKCWEAWDTTCGHKAKDITPLIAWKREAWKEEVLDNLPWKDETRRSWTKLNLNLPTSCFLFSSLINCRGVFHMSGPKHAGDPD